MLGRRRPRLLLPPPPGTAAQHWSRRVHLLPHSRSAGDTCSWPKTALDNYCTFVSIVAETRKGGPKKVSGAFVLTEVYEQGSRLFPHWEFGSSARPMLHSSPSSPPRPPWRLVLPGCTSHARVAGARHPIVSQAIAGRLSNSHTWRVGQEGGVRLRRSNGRRILELPP